MLGLAAVLILDCRPTGSNPFHPSRRPLAAILPLFLRRVQLPIPLGLNLLLMPGEHVLRRHVADRAVVGPIFVNSVGHPLDLNACYQREMKDVLKRAGSSWHGFRRGLASNLNRLRVDDSVIQRFLRHSTVATTQNHYIKTASLDAIAAMKQFSEALLCSTCAPSEGVKVKDPVQ